MALAGVRVLSHGSGLWFLVCTTEHFVGPLMHLGNKAREVGFTKKALEVTLRWAERARRALEMVELAHALMERRWDGRRAPAQTESRQQLHCDSNTGLDGSGGPLCATWGLLGEAWEHAGEDDKALSTFTDHSWKTTEDHSLLTWLSDIMDSVISLEQNQLPQKWMREQVGVKKIPAGAWVAQSFERLTLDFGSGHSRDLVVGVGL